MITPLGIMSVEEYARQILFGTRLDDKLMPWKVPSGAECSDLYLSENALPLSSIPPFPGRPSNLAKPGKATFPALNHLDRPEERGKVLHFFANHELLAMELMALVLLRFPQAPVAFRKGILRIIQEEQSHLSLYLSRMKELGIEFGDFPINDYFWNTMKFIESPLDFTVQMSLTFEQANLDFSLFFKNAIERLGDSITAGI